jgi:hypothetical protein
MICPANAFSKAVSIKKNARSRRKGNIYVLATVSKNDEV